MIIHDYSLFHGWSTLIFFVGSALYNRQSIIPALLSAGLAAFIANFEPAYDWLDERMLSGSVVFTGITFLVSMIVVNRVREASIRFVATQESYGKLNSTLQRLALFFTCAWNDSPNLATKYKEMQSFKVRFLRWIKAIHILAIEEFQGFEVPKHRMGCLHFTEEILLFRESRRAARVLRWMSRGYIKHKQLIAPSAPTDIKLHALIDEAGVAYGATLVVSNGIYPLPLAQISYLSVVIYGVWSPLAFGLMLPHSYFLAPLIAFTSVWLAFGANLAAQLLEWPFDGKENDLPLQYYSIRFVKEMGELEFGVDVPMMKVPFNRLVTEEEEDEDGKQKQCNYVIPQERDDLSGQDKTQVWLQRAAKELEEGLQSRRKLRHGFQNADTRQKYDTGISMSEIRARGKHTTLW